MHDAIENCGTPRCGEWTELQKCPDIKTSCQADDVDDVIKKVDRETFIKLNIEYLNADKP